MNEEKFKNEYKNEMDKQNPSDESIQKISTLLTEKSEKTKNKNKKIPLRIFAAALGCLILFFSLYGPIAKLLQNNIKVPGKIDSYSELYGTISKIFDSQKVYFLFDNNFYEGGDLNLAPILSDQSDSVNISVNKIDYSDTNLQVLGVQESDIIKTDGRYIYALSNEYIYIISADSGNLSVTSKIPASEIYTGDTYSNAFEMYITDSRLIILKANSIYKDDTYLGVPPLNDSYYYSNNYYYCDYIEAAIFDISDKSMPKSVSSFSQSGSYVSSRMIENVLYLVTNKYIYSGQVEKNEYDTYVPSIIVNGEKNYISPSDISINNELSIDSYTNQFLTVSGIDTSGDGSLVSSKSLFGYGSTLYSSLNNMYIAAYSTVRSGNIENTATKLVRLSLNNGTVEKAAEGTVRGYVLNQFSMDEYNDTFRIVTTNNSYEVDENWMFEDSISISQNSSSNNLYVLDLSLNVIGQIEDLAEDERVYSVRFNGDVGYFVTYRQMDPLFCVDLSDSTNPKISSELKIPGFSEYLHVYTDDLLFGLGKSDNGKLKLSMFNVSNPKDVTEESNLILNYTYSEAENNHKAILINSEKNIIAFPSEDKYLVYSYSTEEGFTKEASFSLNGDYNSYYQSMRGLYIEGYLYVFYPGNVSSYNMETYEFFSDLDLQ